MPSSLPPDWAIKLARALIIQFGAETTGGQRDETYRNVARALVTIREDVLETCVEIAEAVQGRAADNAQALMMKPRSMTLDKMREIDNRLAGQRHAAAEIAAAIRAKIDAQ